MNAYETAITNLNQIVSYVDGLREELLAKDRTIAELRSALEACEHENAMLRGDLDEPTSDNDPVQIGKGHLMKPIRDLQEGIKEIEEAECERCNAGYRRTRDGRYLMLDEERLAEPCTGRKDEPDDGC